MCTRTDVHTSSRAPRSRHALRGQRHIYICQLRGTRKRNAQKYFFGEIPPPVNVLRNPLFFETE